MTYYRSKHFRIDEYKCKCGCGLTNMSNEALKKFDAIREDYGRPLKVNSGCRCKEYNQKVGGSPSSAHLLQQDKECYAMDFGCDNAVDRFKLITIALKHGCTRIGVAKTFVHIDFCPYSPQEVVWCY